MKIIFIGTADFGCPTLRLLAQSEHKIVAVVTAVDKPTGRGMKLRKSPVKLLAEELGIDVLQPPKLKNPDFLKTLASYKTDLQVVIAFRMLPREVWDMPRLGTMNLHASLLPQYRGAAPIHWAIINGEKQTGLTTFILKHEIDTGDVLLQEKHKINQDDTLGSVYERLMYEGAKLVLSSLKRLQSTKYTLLEQQDDIELKHAPKIYMQDCFIDLEDTSENVVNKIRGLNPHPTARLSFLGKIYKVHKAEKVQEYINSEQAFLTDGKRYLYLKTQDGWVSILEWQAENKRRMRIEDFLKGNILQT